MKKTLCIFPFVFASSVVGTAQAETTDLGAGFSLSGNAAIVSDYRFRGYSQTNFRPAAQVGIDLTHSSGLYLGNWNSNVSDFVFTDGNLEMDFYGGWKGDLGHGLGLDVGVLQYYYPGSTSPKGGNYKNTDLYLGLSYANYSLKYSYTPTDFFSIPDTKGTWYLDGSATFDLGDGWGVLAHLGYQKLKKQTTMAGGSLGHYVDYKVGVTKEVSGWILGLAAVGASKDNWLPTKSGHPSGRIGAVFSMTRAF